MQKKSHFKETQKFTQWWLWLILIGTSLIPLYGIYIQVLLEKSFGDSPMSNSGLIIFALASFLILFLFYSIQLDTRINKDEILVKFKPFIKK